MSADRPTAPGRDPEYDRFGPWVLEISEDDPLPPRFLPFAASTEGATISVKVPRHVARREAHPGMDLYDYVVAIHEHEVVILERVAQGVREWAFAFAEIKYLSLRSELLRGGLVLGVPGRTYELPYNTVSNELMQRVVAIIRERYLTDAPPRSDLPSPPHADGLSFYFERLLRDERAGETRAALLLAQPDLGLGTLETSPWRKALFGLVDKRLLESLHLSDGRELRVLDRGRHIAYRWQTSYGRRETFVPLADITGASLEPTDAATNMLTVTTDGGELTWLLGRDTPGAEAYAEWLEGLAATRR